MPSQNPGSTTGLNSQLTRADERLGRLTARLRGTPAIDRMAYGLSEAANNSVLWHSINLVDFLVGIRQRDPMRRHRAVRRTVIHGVEQAVVNGPVKMLVNRKRPTPDTAHPHQLRVPVTSSFPSGHSTAGACAAELLAADMGHRTLWWTLAVAVGWSRVHVGVHHPSDVLAGWLIGALGARLAAHLWPAPFPDPTSTHQPVI